MLLGQENMLVVPAAIFAPALNPFPILPIPLFGMGKRP
jgi:hypothetical protein